MSIILTIEPGETITSAELRDSLGNAQVPFQETDRGFTVTCADEGTAAFWDERVTAWGATVQREGEAGDGFGTPDVAPAPADAPSEPADAPEDDDEANTVLPGDSEAQPGESGTDVQPS